MGPRRALQRMGHTGGVTACFVICAPAECGADGLLTAEGRQQCERLGEGLSLHSEANGQPSCVVAGAHGAGAVTARELCRAGPLQSVPLLSEAVALETEGGGGNARARIQRTLTGLVGRGGTVVLVVPRPWRRICARMMGRSDAPMRPGAARVLRLPCRDSRGEWECETATRFAEMQPWIARMAGLSGEMWPDRGSIDWGEPTQVRSTPDWKVLRDVWTMEDMCRRGGALSKRAEFMPLLCITHSPALRCMRDLTPRDLPALSWVDSAYPDEDWVKYLHYPPTVWRLHIRVQRRGTQVQGRNVYLLSDVIGLVKSGRAAEAPLLVYRAGRA